MDTVMGSNRSSILGTSRMQSEASLQAKDIAAFIMAAVRILGPLAEGVLFRELARSPGLASRLSGARHRLA